MTIYEINLQLFALSGQSTAQNGSNHVNVTTDNTVGSNDLSYEMKTYYDMTLIDEAGPQLVHDQFGQKRPIPVGGGKQIEFRKFDNLPKAMTPLVEGVTPVGSNLNVTNIIAEVSQYGNYITQSDVLELTALDNTILEATKILGKQAGLTLDTVTRNVLQAGTKVMYAPKIDGSTGAETEVTSRADLDSTCRLTVDLVQQVVAELSAQNAPKINGYYVAIVHPYVMYDLMRDPEWKNVKTYSDPADWYAGELGEICGVRFVGTSEAKIYRGEDLAKDGSGNPVRTLKVNHGGGYTGAITSVAFDGGNVEADALIGKVIEINGVRAKVTDNDTTTITFASTNFGTIADDAVISPAASVAGAVFGSLFLAEGAYGITDIEGGGLQTIVKQKGSAGTADPLDQRSSVGWKAIKTAERLVENYMIRVESTSPRYSATAKEN